jgi:hypothetical protein
VAVCLLKKVGRLSQKSRNQTNPYVGELDMSRNRTLLSVSFALFIAGFLIFTLQLDQTPEQALKNLLQTLTLVSYGGYHSGTWAETVYLVASFALVLFLGAIAVERFLEWSKREIDGSGSVRRADYLLVNPIDWEKVASVADRLKVRLGRRPCLVVVVSEFLDELPLHLKKRGVRFIKGSLRCDATYLRAGVMKAKGAFICPPTYNDPVLADRTTLGYVRIVERMTDGRIKSVVEVVSEDHKVLFDNLDHSADALVFFDPITLGRVVCEMIDFTSLCRAHVRGAVVPHVYDPFQAEEFVAQGDKLQFEEYTHEDGGLVRVILPTNFDDPSQSDNAAHAELLTDRDVFMHNFVLFLSVESADLFAGHANTTAICADRVVADKMVEQMMG